MSSFRVQRDEFTWWQSLHTPKLTRGLQLLKTQLTDHLKSLFPVVKEEDAHKNAGLLPNCMQRPCIAIQSISLNRLLKTRTPDCLTHRSDAQMEVNYPRLYCGPAFVPFFPCMSPKIFPLLQRFHCCDTAYHLQAISCTMFTSSWICPSVHNHSPDKWLQNPLDFWHCYK